MIEGDGAFEATHKKNRLAYILYGAFLDLPSTIGQMMQFPYSGARGTIRVQELQYAITRTCEAHVEVLGI